MRFETSVEVEATPEAVWRAVVDVVAWPEITASMRRVEWVTGDAVAVGSVARIKQPGLPASTWAVTAVVPGTSFTWESTAPGVRTVATHELAAAGPGRTTLVLGLAQSGPLAPLLGALVGARARRFVSMEAAGLKKKSEAAGPVA